MVRSGEASGNLAGVLAELASYLERSKAVRGSVVSALIYPAILAVVAALSIFIMLGFVVPEFEALFEDMGDALPLLTRIIVGLGDIVAVWGWVLLVAQFGWRLVDTTVVRYAAGQTLGGSSGADVASDGIDNAQI